jgi:nucleotide-binding universal stress UspA family protein
MKPGDHTLVVYGASPRADSALQALVEAPLDDGGRLTVLSLVVQEPEANGCCDRRSVMWNEVQRAMARENLARARLAVDGHPAVELDVVAFSGRRAADVVIREAVARNADVIVLADARSAPIGALERRRLRRKSPVPVSEGAAELAGAG